MHRLKISIVIKLGEMGRMPRRIDQLFENDDLNPLLIDDETASKCLIPCLSSIIQTSHRSIAQTDLRIGGCKRVVKKDPIRRSSCGPFHRHLRSGNIQFYGIAQVLKGSPVTNAPSSVSPHTEIDRASSAA